jgi:aminoglycoside 3-N-acetyltransferase
MQTATMTSREAEAVASMLDAGAVPDDGVLVLHSAFGGLSRAGYRAEAFIDALLERMRHGTVLMPAMSWRTVTPDQPAWDERTTASHVGVVTELFRTRYAEARSIHPTHSVCGLGPAAEGLLAGHHLGDTPCPAASPWGRLAAQDAFILMLGVGFETCTALHHPEEIVAPQLYLKPPGEAVTYRCTSRDGTAFAVRMRHHLRLDRDFPQYDRRLGKDGRLVTGQLPGTQWRLVGARALMDDAFANLEARPDAHIAATKGCTA